jgi:hypothetical protein
VSSPRTIDGVAARRVPIRPAPSSTSVQGSGIGVGDGGDSDVSAPLTTCVSLPAAKTKMYLLDDEL